MAFLNIYIISPSLCYDIRHKIGIYTVSDILWSKLNRSVMEILPNNF